ncbi:hypothetical protein ES707_18608 [subsurface metagenome]
MDYKQQVNKRFEELGPLHDRMLIDRGIYFLAPYVMKDYQDKEIQKVDNVTSRDPRNFADRIIAVLNSAEPPPEVEGESLNDKDMGALEAFWYAARDDANKRLATKMMMPIHPFLVWHDCMSGWVVLRVWLYEDEGGLQFDILPLDPLDVAWDVGGKGLLYAAHKIKKSKALIEMEYGKVIEKKEDTVIDCYGETDHVVYVGDDIVKQEPNPFGKVPFVIKPVQLTPMVSKVRESADAIANYGESLYSAIRGTGGSVEVMNQFLSILQTLNMQYFRWPLGIKTESGQLPEGDILAAGAQTPLGIRDDIVKMPVGEIKEAGALFYSIISGEFQRATLPYSDWGDLPFQLPDLALARLDRQRDQFLEPRIRTLEQAYADVANMVLEQYQKFGFKAKVRIKDKEIDFKLPDAKKPFTISFHMATTSPEKDISNYALAAKAKALELPTSKVWRDILHIEDISETESERLSELAAMLSPKILLYRLARNAIQQAEELTGEEAEVKWAEAKILSAELQMGEEEIAGRPVRKPALGETRKPPEAPLAAEEKTAEAQITRTEEGRGGPV